MHPGSHVSHEATRTGNDIEHVHLTRLLHFLDSLMYDARLYHTHTYYKCLIQAAYIFVPKEEWRRNTLDSEELKILIRERGLELRRCL